VYAEFIDSLGNQSMSNTVPATGTVMRRTIFKGRCSLKYRFHTFVLSLVSCVLTLIV
jgi:hypothetical protein